MYIILYIYIGVGTTIHATVLNGILLPYIPYTPAIARDTSRLIPPSLAPVHSPNPCVSPTLRHLLPSSSLVSLQLYRVIMTLRLL